jgi:ZIP family zinc transporter
MTWSLLAAVLFSVGFSTVLGMLLGLCVKKLSERHRGLILGFAAGVMLSAAMLGLIAPAFSAKDTFSIMLAVAGVLAGALSISFLDKAVPHLHRIAGVGGEESHENNRAINKALLFVLAIGIHKLPEGLATGVSFGTGSVSEIMMVSAAISIQNIPEAFVIVSPLVAIGLKARRIAFISVSIAVISILSVLTGLALVSVFSGAVPFMLAAAGGAMVYVISDEMIPETHAHGNERFATYSLIGGMLLVVLLQIGVEKMQECLSNGERNVSYCVVGSAPDDGVSSSLHLLRCDTQSGMAKIVQSVEGVQGTTYFQVDKKSGKLYSFISEKRNGKKRGAAVSFDVKGNRISQMSKFAELPCEVPCHVELSPDGNFYAFAAYTSGIWGEMPIPFSEKDFRLISCQLQNENVGPRADRQKKAYAHCVLYTPDGKNVGVVDLGCDAIFFHGKGRNGLLSKDETSKSAFVIKLDPGDGPRHAIFSKCGKYLFVLNELSSSVTSFAYDGVNKFKRLGKWSMVPEGTDVFSTKAAAIKLTDDGRVLLASNRGHDSISFFEVKPNGELELKNIAPLTGKSPRDFALVPGEKFVVVGHKMSNEIQIYRFDRENFNIIPEGKPIPCCRPLCFKFL